MMKIVHWCLTNNSGMHRVASEMSHGEKIAGIDSVIIDPFDPTQWENSAGADIFVLHTHIPNEIAAKNKKIPVVYIAHGTPEHVFQSSVEAGLNQGYGASDPLMFTQYWLQRANVVCVFWERAKWIWGNMAPKQDIRVLPMGIDKSQWHPVESRGKYAGSPSVMIAENCHYIKWPLDIVYAWPEVCEVFPNATLHLFYLPRDQHRWWYPLMNSNGTAFHAHTTADVLDVEGLRNAFCSTDFYLNPVRYGDFNRVGLEAASCGAKVISYEGNPYAHYHLREGDQRRMGAEIVEILAGKTQENDVEQPPTLEDMVDSMLGIYGGLV